jgi:hypothetical protein
VCGIEDRLILNALDTQHDCKAKAGAIRRMTQTDIGMYNGARSDFFLAHLGRNFLVSAQEACCVFFCIRIAFIPTLVYIVNLTYQSNQQQGVDRGCVRYRHSRQPLWESIA